MDGVPQLAGDQRRSGAAGNGLRNASAPGHGDPDLHAQRGAGAQGFDGQRAGDPRGRGAIHGGGHGRAAQRVQPVEEGGGASAADLDSTGPNRSEAAVRGEIAGGCPSRR